MTSPLAVQVMRFGFLGLLWIFVFVLIRVMRADMRASSAPRMLTSGGRTGGRKQRRTTIPSGGHGPTQLLVTEGGLAGTRVALTGKPIFVGRANDSTLVLTDDYVSTRHARISNNGGVWYLEDLGSTNGTYVGNSKVDGPVPLEPGTQIRIGKTVMELR